MMKDIRCPECQSRHIVKRGKRKQRFRIVQIYQCKECKKRFVTKPLEHKMYPAQVIYSAINYYNLGHTLDETSILVNKKFKVKTSRSTVHLWIKEFQSLCPISTMRDSFYEEEVLFTKKFEHENLDYEFMYHKYKLEILVQEQFPGLAKYITRFESGCPDVFFEVGERCSQPKFKVQVEAKKKMNLACKMTAFAVQAARHNRERHTVVEQFMIINDRATVACEVPVWYWDKKIDNGVTGHVDILQVRNNLVYILDYKPDAAKDKKAAGQLYQYALALSFRTKIPLHSIRCAWFDEKSYYEYSPTEANATLIKKKEKRRF